MNENTNLLPPIEEEERKNKLKLLILEFLLLSLTIILVILPPFGAQQALNYSTINVKSLSITNPKENSFNIFMSSIISAHISASAVIYEAPVGVYYEGSELGSINLKETTIYGDTKLIIKDKFKIKDTKLMGKFSNALISNQFVGWELRANVKIRVLGFIEVSNLNLNKKMELKGKIK